MIKPWKEIKREEAFRKYSRKIDMVLYEMPDGSQSDFYVKNEGPAAGVLALTDDDQVILARQFRPGPNEILLELPGGFVEDGESGKAAMERELLEETGYQGEIELVTECLDDAYSTMRRYCYVAKGCKKVTEINNDKDEQTEVVLLTLDDFRKLLRSGKSTDAEVGYLGLDYLGLL